MSDRPYRISRDSLLVVGPDPYVECGPDLWIVDITQPPQPPQHPTCIFIQP